MYSKIAVVGERELILSFKALGIPIFPVVNLNEALEMVKKLVKENYSLILLTEEYASQMKELMGELRTKPGITVTPIPTARGSKGFALEELKAVLRKAIGVDIFG